MVPIIDALEKVAPTDATVLLTGESGTGKEVAARFVHARSSRADGPFMAVNCATLSGELLASELFGHEKGAFTGAHARKRGRIELAAGGSFFLDEIGELQTDVQAKLLRVLEERTFERVGGTQQISADVRWIAATNRDLEARVEGGEFRADLFHRLAVFPVALPPLRKRKEDVLPLARVLLERIGGDLGRPGLSLPANASHVLESQAWSGNVRELRNVLERAAILAGDAKVIDAAHLVTRTARAAKSEGRTLAEIERDAILRALELEDGNRQRAAERLQIGVRTLYSKLKRYGLSS
jgi:two-component system response regulator FlrC